MQPQSSTSFTVSTSRSFRRRDVRSVLTTNAVGYSHGGKNGTGYQSGEELYSEKTNIEGLLEFVGPPKANQNPQVPATTKRLNTFSHVGLVVPDTQKVEKRLKKFGIKILKAVGEMPVPGTATAG